MSSENKNSMNIFALSRAICNESYKDKFVSTDDLLYQYDDKRYLYKKVTDVFLRRHLRKLILSKLVTSSGLSEYSIAGITENIKALLDIEDLSENQFFDKPLKRNQYFFPLQKTTLEIRIVKNNLAIIEHGSSPKFFTTKTVAYPYSKRAGCKVFIKFLREVLGAKEILLLQEWFGYTLIPDTRAHKMMIYKGRGRNGKSVIMLLHRLLLGLLNVSSIPIRGFSPNEKFLLGHTENKLLNQVEEVDSDARLTTSVVKRYISGGIVQGEPKFKMAKDFIPTARIEIATNHDVDFEDDSDGFKERLIILPFKNQFLKHHQNKDFIDADFWIESGELSGIFNWAVRGLKRLVANDWNFTEVESVKEELNEYKSNLNYTADFIENYLEVAPEQESLFGIQMYKAYEAHCEHHGLIPKKDSVLSKEILNSFSTVKKGKDAEPTEVRLFKGGRKIRSHRFSGIRFKSDALMNTATAITGTHLASASEVRHENE